jgi:hypothetical protein
MMIEITRNHPADMPLEKTKGLGGSATVTCRIEIATEPAEPTWREQYHAYLRSADWADKRLLKRILTNDNCERCGARGEQCHHLTYQYLESVDGKIIDHTPLNMLAWMCAPCHRFLHGLEPAQSNQRRPRLDYDRLNAVWGGAS